MALNKIEIPKYSLSEELINAITHGIGAGLSVAALVLCIVKGANDHNAYAVVSASIYGSFSIILYLCSCLYHSLKVNNGKRVFRIIDHCTIYLLIFGTYTPYALVALPKAIGWVIFSVNLACMVIGVTLNAVNLNKFKKVSMVLYLVMGWMIIFTFPTLIKSVDIKCIYLTLLGGILYTVGAIMYGIGKKKKYMHSVFHVFVLLASISFFFAIYLYIM